MADLVPLHKRVILKNIASGGSIRIKENYSIDGKGKEGKFAQFDVLEGPNGSIRLHSVASPGFFLGIKNDGTLFAGKGGERCEFKVLNAEEHNQKRGKEAHPGTIILVHATMKNKLPDKDHGVHVGILPNGVPKNGHKTGFGKCAQFLPAIVGEADLSTARAVAAGTYQRAADVQVGKVAVSADQKRALLVGCNYPGTANTLRGCINDVAMMKDNLLKIKGFKESNIKLMLDTDPSTERPTGRNIKKALQELVLASKPGDCLFFHFSGHGTQIPAEGGSGSEKDGKDEAIVPTDLNLITDNDLRIIVEKLPAGADFTFVADCCHSGGILDNTTVAIGEGSAPAATSGLFGSRDFTHENRSLSVEALTRELSVHAGTTVAPTNIRRSLLGLFGHDSSISSISFADYFSSLLGLSYPPAASNDDEDSYSTQDDMMVHFFGAPVPPPAVPAPIHVAAAAAVPVKPPPAKPTLYQTFGGQDPSVLFNGPLPPNPNYKPTVGKPSVDERLDAEKGILICGCQSSQTSADVCPSSGGAYGALTHTLTTILRANPTISYSDLVNQVRGTLVKGGFSQQPGLECSGRNGSRPFICPSV